MKKNILFICKHNIFRSRIAEEYMKKISNHNISSAGLISTKLIAPKEEQVIAKKYGLNIKNKSKTMSIELLNEQDIIIIVADNVPIDIFDIYGFNILDKIRVWKIKDVDMRNVTEKSVIKIVKQIIERCDELKEELE